DINEICHVFRTETHDLLREQVVITKGIDNKVVDRYFVTESMLIVCESLKNTTTNTIVILR
ncbi:hypothetical protein HAX54_029429, partial [Datura stramonium]|nr:hypothetical protein [Datura stramonium]